jgi:hypothetical protein
MTAIASGTCNTNAVTNLEILHVKPRFWEADVFKALRQSHSSCKQTQLCTFDRM